MKKLPHRLKKHTIRYTVVSIFILATLITATVAIGLQYYFSKSMATETASELFQLASKNTKNHLLATDIKAESLTLILAQIGELVADNEIAPDTYNIFAEVLKSNSDLYAIYIGIDNGDFYELINLDASPKIRNQINASFKDRWVSVTVNGQGEQRKRTFNYFDENMALRTSRAEPSNYDATTRPWFVNASQTGVYRTDPYLFQHLQAPGRTYSTKVPNTNITLAVDIALSSIDDYLTKQGLNAQGKTDKDIYLFQQSGEIISTNKNNTAHLRTLSTTPLKLTAKEQQLVQSSGEIIVSNENDWAPIDFSVAGKPHGYSIDYLNLISQMTGLNFKFVNGFSWLELTKKFKNNDIDILQPIFKNKVNDQLGLYSDSFLSLPFAIITQENTDNITHLSQLDGKQLAIPAGWSIIESVKEHFPQISIVELVSTKAVLEAVANGDVYAGLDNEVIFSYTQKQFFIENIKYHDKVNFSPADVSHSLHFMLDKSQTDLLAIINKAINHIGSEQHQLLEDKWLAHKQVTKQELSVVPYKELLQLTQQKDSYDHLVPLMIDDTLHYIYLTPANHDHTEFLAILTPSESIFASSNAKVQLSILITSVCLFFVLPVSWLFSGPIVKPIKLLAQENEKIKNRQYAEVTKVATNIKEIDALAISLVDMSSAIQHHEKSQIELMDAFIQLIAQTIDDKSPYTGNHCKRVPDLGISLANAAAESNSAPFKDFSFRSPEEYREFKTAAWLHDCGKIITPEHIVDKGSKLETIYNRIHEIRMRFEVLWRDAEIQFHQQLAQNPEQKQQLKEALTNKQQQLSEDFAFIANANVGGEFMSDDKVARLSELAKITWQRHFDDTLGLSPVEELNLKSSKAALPATETLLIDKPEHIIARTSAPNFDDKLGIKMTVPEHQYNLGELYNLSISRGTLTAEDRFKINEHIIGTIKMLDKLPFPKELARVPKYASTHHETLIGTGYPRKLSAEDLSIPERVLVIADIFEALTAGDRPYKKAKPLSVAVDILHKFALDQHIDFDLFELFLTSGVYLDFAQKHMKAEQIDEVDIDKYLRKEEKKLAAIS